MEEEEGETEVIRPFVDTEDLDISLDNYKVLEGDEFTMMVDDRYFGLDYDTGLGNKFEIQTTKTSIAITSDRLEYWKKERIEKKGSFFSETALVIQHEFSGRYLGISNDKKLAVFTKLNEGCYWRLRLKGGNPKYMLENVSFPFEKDMYVCRKGKNFLVSSKGNDIVEFVLKDREVETDE